MEIVNINDIEELVIAKYKIEEKLIEDGKLEQKMSINDFLVNYAQVNYVYKFKNLMIPFGYNKINNIDYLFVITKNEDELNILTNKLKLLRYNLSNMVKVDYNELMINEHIDEEDFIIFNNNYYR